VDLSAAISAKVQKYVSTVSSMDIACYSGTHADTNTASASLFISVALELKLIQELVCGIVGIVQVDKL